MAQAIVGPSQRPNKSNYSLNIQKIESGIPKTQYEIIVAYFTLYTKSIPEIILEAIVSLHTEVQ